MLGSTLPTNTDLYLTLCLEDEPKVLPIPRESQSLQELLQSDNMNDLPPPAKTKLLYHVNKVNGVHYLCIPPSVNSNILTIAHKEKHLGFSRSYEIITCFWFIQGLTKLLRAFIHYCPQCLTF